MSELKDNIINAFDDLVDRDYTLDTLGIDKDDFIQDFKDELMDKVYQIARERMDDAEEDN